MEFEVHTGYIIVHESSQTGLEIFMYTRNSVYFGFSSHYSHQWHCARHRDPSARHTAHHAAGEQRWLLQDEPAVRHSRQLLLQSTHPSSGHLQVLQTLSRLQTG